MQMRDKHDLGYRVKSLDGRAHNMQITAWPKHVQCAQILTDFAKLKKLLVSPVTILDEPANGRFPSQAIANENHHLLLHMEEWQFCGQELENKCNPALEEKGKWMGGVQLT